MKSIYAVIFSFIIIFSSCAYAAENNSGDTYGAGLIWEQPEDINEGFEGISIFDSALPASVDLTDSFPAPRNQGLQNSCAAWAVSYALMSHQIEQQQHWTLDTDEHLFSPSYVYNIYSKGNDNGSTLSAAANIIRTNGACTLASFPYNDKDCSTQPTDEQICEAMNYRIKNYKAVYGIDSIKSCLADGNGVAISFHIYEDFREISEENPIYDTAEGNRSGSHAVCLIGYDDEKGAFKFINSYGADWGLNGYGWISYDLFSRQEVNHYGYPMGYTLVMRDKNEYTEGFFDYTVINGEAEICNYFGNDEYISIPDTIGGFPVTGIGEGAFMHCASIKGISMPKSIKYIGKSAFKLCRQLEEIRIPDSVTYIGDEAFANCSLLKSVVIPENTVNIGKKVFHFFDNSTGNSSVSMNVVLKCAENSAAHKYALENGHRFTIIDFRDCYVITDMIQNSAEVDCSSFAIEYTSENMCTVSALYLPMMKEIPQFIIAVYDGEKMTNVYASEDGEVIENVSADDLKSCKIFIWTQKLQPCIYALNPSENTINKY